VKRKPKATNTLRDTLAEQFRQAAVVIGRRFDRLGAIGQEDLLDGQADRLDAGESVIVETWRLQDALPKAVLGPSSMFTVHPDGTYTAGVPATTGADTAPGR
jgi:hypothetical protein